MMIEDFNVMRILNLTEKSYLDWNLFVSNHPDATFFHTLKWMQILKEYGFRMPFYFLLYDQSDVIGVLPLYLVNVFPFGQGLTSLPDCNGLLINSSGMSKDFLLGVLTALEGIAEKQRLAFFKLRFLSSSPLNQFMPNYYVRQHDYCTFILDLSQGTEYIFKHKLHKKTRNAIRKAIKLGVGVDKKCPKVETYWTLYRETMSRTKGILDDSRVNLFRLIWRRLKHGEDFITLTATFENKPIGGIMAFLFKDKAHIWYNASLSRYLYLNPNEFLYWKLIEELTDKGYKYLDFGPTPLNPTEGHYLFKSRFGGTLIPFNDYAYFTSKIRYLLYEGGILCLAKKLGIRRKGPQIMLRKIGERTIF
jgi:hypothetical protein